MDVVLIGGFQEVFEALEENSYSIKGYIDLKRKEMSNNFNWLGTDIDAILTTRVSILICVNLYILMLKFQLVWKLMRGSLFKRWYISLPILL